MNIYQLVSTIGALLLYIPLIVKILRKKIHQSLATFILLLILDSVSTILLFMQDGNWYLSASYSLGCALVVGSIIKVKGSDGWGKTETFVFCIVCSCLIVWYLLPGLATIIFSLGVGLAFVPQIKDAWLYPKLTPKLLYFMNSLVASMSVIGGADWSVEQRFFPLVCTVVLFTVGAMPYLKYFIKPRSA